MRDAHVGYRWALSWKCILIRYRKHDRKLITYPPPLNNIHISGHCLNSIDVSLVLSLPRLLGVNGILAVTFIVGIGFKVPKQTMDTGFLLSGWGMRMQGGDGVDTIVPLNELRETSDGKKIVRM